MRPAMRIVVLALLPAGVTIVQSFFTVNALDPPVRFSGLDNFRELFANPDVLSSAVNTSFYVLVGVVLSTVLGIAMAVALQAPFRGRSVVIAIMILPWALPGVVEAVSEQSGGVLVRLATPAGPILSRITHRSAGRLAARPGEPLTAIVKSLSHAPQDVGTPRKTAQDADHGS